jgi:hypothetical protein
LEASVAAYSAGEGSPDAGFSIYHSLNRLALQALTGLDAQELVAAVDLARYAAKAAEQTFDQRTDDPWPAVMQAEAVLVEKLLNGTLCDADETGDVAFAVVLRAYEETLADITLKPSQLDSVIAQMEMLSRFLDALALGPAKQAALRRRCADRLLELVQCLRPGRPSRNDRTPPDAPIEPEPPAGAAPPVGPPAPAPVGTPAEAATAEPAPRRQRAVRAKPKTGAKPKTAAKPKIAGKPPASAKRSRKT